MGIKVHQNMVDTSSYANVIFLNTYRRIGIGSEYIRPCSDKIVEFGRNKVRPVGTVDLAIELGDYPCQKTIITEFKIMDTPSPYNAILRKPLLMVF